MTPLTAKALSDQEEFYIRPVSALTSYHRNLRSDKYQLQQERVEIAQSHAAKVVQEEQIQMYFTQRGIAEGHDIMTGERVVVSRLGEHENASTHGGGGAITSRDARTRREAGSRDNNNNNGDSWDSIKMFMPRQPPTRGPERPYEATGVTPLERFLMHGESNDPSYIRRQAQCYGDMGSVEARAHQAQMLADKVVRDGQARKGSTRDGFVYK